jgi:opacity protein-like surface antigen
MAISKVALVSLLVLAIAGPAEAQKKKGKQGDFNVFLRGGVGDYTGDLGDITSAGPVWGLTFNIQPTNVIGWELSYNGSRNVVQDQFLANDPFVNRNGATGMVKLGLPFVQRVKPFVGAGFGASYANVTTQADGRYQDDLMEEIPLAAGIEFNSGGITAGLRGQYRYLFDEGWADPGLPGSPQGSFLDGELTFGARF